MFVDREDAARKLAERLPPLDADTSLILALPRGGVPVGDVIARALGVPLDIVLVRKVGLPGQPEVAVAAVSDGDDPKLAVNEALARRVGLDENDIRALAETQLSEIRRRREVYLHGRAPLSLTGKTVVVVDDGLATGATMRAALRMIRDGRPSRVIVAVPVAPPEALADLAGDCDDIVCLEAPEDFRAVSLHYRTFDQVPDSEVTRILDLRRTA